MDNCFYLCLLLLVPAWRKKGGWRNINGDDQEKGDGGRIRVIRGEEVDEAEI